MLRDTLKAAALLLLCWASLHWSTPVAPHATSGFSAAEAMRHLRWLAGQPRPLATEANAEARAYLLAQLRAMGLAPSVQTETMRHTQVDDYGGTRVTIAVVNNIVVVLPGTAPAHAERPAVLLATHYDSGGRGVGATHPASTVAAVLDTVRRLQRAAPLADDLVILLADGDEVDALGSKAFAERHPLARRIGTVLQFDSKGAGGPLWLTHASGAAASVVRAWAQLSPLPAGSSAMTPLFASGGHETTMGGLAGLGSARLHFANIGATHGPGDVLDTLERLDQATLRETGDTMFALVRAGATVEQTSTFFALSWLGIVQYSATTAWLLAVAACLLAAVVFARAVRRGEVRPRESGQSVMLFIVLAAGTVVLAFVCWQLLLSYFQFNYDPNAIGADRKTAWFALANAALATSLFLAIQRAFMQVYQATEIVLGCLVGLCAVLVAATALAPHMAYALAWPLIAALAMSLFGRARWMGAIPAIAMLVPLYRDAFMTLSAANASMAVGMLAVLLGLLAPVLTSFHSRRAALVPLLAMAIFTTCALRTKLPPAPPPPRAEQLTYFKDTRSWKAYWLLPEGPLDAITAPYFRETRGPVRLVDVFGWSSPPVWMARAPKNHIAFPDIAVLKDDDGPLRRIEFRMRSANKAPVVNIWVSGAFVDSAWLNGEVISTGHASPWQITLYGVKDLPLTFAFDVESFKLTFVDIQERIPGLPVDGAAHGRPVGTTISTDTLLFR